MSDDKISISMDEVNRATPVPGAAPQTTAIPGCVPPESSRADKPDRTGLFVGLGIAAVALISILAIGVAAIITDGISRTREKTVADYRVETIKEVEEELAKPGSALKKRIEAAHMTVDVTSTRIVRCDVTTIDGSDRAGQDDSNIDKVSMLIRFNWQGIIDSGYTDLRVEYDAKNDRLLKSEIEYTTALVNAEDPAFWWDVGFILGSCL